LPPIEEIEAELAGKIPAVEPNFAGKHARLIRHPKFSLRHAPLAPKGNANFTLVLQSIHHLAFKRSIEVLQTLN
jgi:hypothetical protein